MQKKSKKKKYYIFIFLVITFILLSIFYIKNNSLEIKDYIKKSISPNLFAYLQVTLDNKRSTNKLYNDYNTKFLPETEFTNINLEKINLVKFFKNKRAKVGYAKNLQSYVKKPFYIDDYLNNLILLTSDGEIFYNDIDELLKTKVLFKIENNLDFITSLDIFIEGKNIYISGIKMKDKCAHFQVAKSEINNLNNFNFIKIFSSNECSNLPQAGRIQKLYDTNSILISTAADILKRSDEFDVKPQDNNSIFGKIIKLDLNDYSYSIFSKGHRNILGLYSDENVILATENGPKGGDEINKIVLNGNYGWPIVSYGQKYNFKQENKELDYKDSHEDLGFKEPIYSFLPSIGISEIVKLDTNFSKKWKNNFLVASLNGNHIYRIRFNKNFEKIIYMERILIGERIRDILFFKDKGLIFLALETYGNLGILKEKQ